MIFHPSPPVIYTSFIGISITTLSYFRKTYLTFCYIFPFETSIDFWTRQLNGEMTLQRFMNYILWDKNSFPPHSGKYLSHGQKGICSCLSFRQGCSSSFTELNSYIKDRVQSSDVMVRLYKSSCPSRWGSYYLPVFHMLNLSEQVVIPRFCLNAVRQILLFVFPSHFFPFKDLFALQF